MAWSPTDAKIAVGLRDGQIAILDTAGSKGLAETALFAPPKKQQGAQGQVPVPCAKLNDCASPLCLVAVQRHHLGGFQVCRQNTRSTCDVSSSVQAINQGLRTNARGSLYLLRRTATWTTFCWMSNLERVALTDTISSPSRIGLRAGRLQHSYGDIGRRRLCHRRFRTRFEWWAGCRQTRKTIRRASHTKKRT